MPNPTDELAARRAAWVDARHQGAYMVVVQRGEALAHFPLAQLRILAGDTIVALVSPYSQEPTLQPEANA